MIEAVLNNARSWHVETTDCRAGLARLPDGCVHCCVTSPPYWALRSYLPADHADKGKEIGSEPTPDAFIKTMVDVFSDVRRVLRDDGLLFMNLGDNYAQDTKWGGRTGGKHAKGLHGTTGIGRGRTKTGLKSGDLCNMPNRVASALQADGWCWRDTIVWHKPSPMPSSQNGVRWERCRIKVATADRGSRSDSVARNGKPMADHHGHDFSRNEYEPCPGCKRCSAHPADCPQCIGTGRLVIDGRDVGSCIVCNGSGRFGGFILRRGRFRTTTAHEYIFMFSKSKLYFADAEACKEKAEASSISRGKQGISDGKSNRYLNGAPGQPPNSCKQPRPNEPDRTVSDTRLPRSVWKISPEPFKGAHFAVFPSEIPRRCLEMATSPRGCCPGCGAQYAPVVETERIPTRPALNNKIWKGHGPERGSGGRSASAPNLDPERHIQRTNVLDYWPTCDCDAGPPVPQLVMDLFNGSGTVGVVARRLGLRYIGFEMSSDYADMSRKRIRDDQPLLNAH